MIEEDMQEMEGEFPPRSNTDESSSIAEAAQKMIGPVLVNYFKGKLRGQSAEKSISGYSLKILRNFGLSILNITPYKFSPDRGYSLGTQLTIGDYIKNNILQDFFGEYALLTDFRDKNWYELKERILEFRIISDDIEDCSTDTRAFQRCVFNPYVVVMGMDYDKRPLAVMAVSEMYEQKVYMSVGKNRIEELYFDRCKESLTPKGIDFIKAAEKYDVKEIIPVIDEFNSVLKHYKEIWVENEH